MNEGKLFAKELLNLGIKVEFISDAMTALYVPQVDAALVGADEILKNVSTSSGGFFTVDDEYPIPVEGNDLTYENVLPNEAVLVEQYDNFYYFSS